MIIKNVVKPVKLSLAMLASMAIAGSCNAAPAPTVTTTYQGSWENFPNPERGFYGSGFYTTYDRSPLQLTQFQELRNKGITLIRRYYHIPEYRYSELPQTFLDLVAQDYKTARQAGAKLIVRFIYSLDFDDPDTSRDKILSHLEQLKSVLRKNKDVTAFMEAGFIGPWGEWHHSTNSLDTNSEDRKAILNKILSVLPKERMVVLRYLRHKIDAFNNKNPLTPAEAFNGSSRARTGAHNDCFVAKFDDEGTYYTEGLTIEDQKKFLSLDNRYLVQGGETCRTSEYSNCPNVLKEMERLRWTYINSAYEQNVLQGWKEQGCMEEISRRLGYRFRLLDATLPTQLKPTGTFSMRFRIANDGWANAINPRKLEVILRHSQTGKEYYLPVAEPVRMWMAGETREVNIVGGIPANLPQGEYQVLLNLPDPTTSLYKRPEYSIRLANKNVWEASTGYNSLLQKIVIAPNAVGNNYSGDRFFTAR